MSTTIFIKIRYTLLGKISFGVEPTELRFTVPIDETYSVNVEFLPKDNEVITWHKKEVTNNMWEFLHSGNHEVPIALHAEFLEIKSGASLSARKVLTYIKYHLGCIELNEQLMSHKEAQWSTDNINWNMLPLLIKAYMDSYSIHPLNEKNAVAIQQFIDHKIEPFLALRHLHKARNESLPHYKWIDATIAAELAIKEFLIRYKPELETLILEMPSPPLQKLYGSVLESLGLPKSPRVREIAKGVEIRNKLVHRPGQITIDLDEANKYVRDIEIAIYHLINLLHKNEPNIKYFYYAGQIDQAS